jgi:hypothetical protein
MDLLDRHFPESAIAHAQRLLRPSIVPYQRQPDILPLVNGCPCEGCPEYSACARSGHECKTFTQWVQRG